MTNDDRIRKSSIMERLGENDNPVSVKEFCWLLRQNGLSHSQGYFHYTTWGRLNNMLVPVDVGDKRKKRLFILSDSSTLNDAIDNNPGVYLASFSFGKEEEVSMWTNYGVPKHEAVRIRFPLAAMTQWAKANTRDKIMIYVQENEGGPFHVVNEKPEEIYFADVAYYGRNDPSDTDSREGVRYKGMSFGFREDRWRDYVNRTNDAILFKKRGWAYEREVRLIVRFDDAAKIRRYNKIAIPFDSVYDAMLTIQKKAEREKTDGKKSVMYGPWYSKKAERLGKIRGIRTPCHSTFEGELRMRSNCDKCDNKQNPQKCMCPNAEWMLWDNLKKGR